MLGTMGRLRTFAVAALVLAAIAVAASPAAAQDRTAPVRQEPPAAFSSFFLSTGTLLMDVTKLNPHFERLDLDAKNRPGFFALSNDAYSVGVGGYGVIYNRVLLGAEFSTADIGSESSPVGKTNQLTTWYGMGTIGYAAWTTWNLSVTPFVGIGAGTATLTLQSRDGGATVRPDQDPTFDEVIMSPGLRSVMKGRYVLVQPGLAVDYLVLRDTKSSLGLTIGVRLGSNISPNRTTWTYGGRTVYGGPDAGPTGGTFRIVAGIGGFRLAGR
ncbi:MAG: hypothetical protein U9Q74_07295 [Gemmatimonadota bacterium]|nr:hypothetical protein [Gemmatimonadota bacterium]